ncbi:unnamed protein product [Caretta caretta]
MSAKRIRSVKSGPVSKRQRKDVKLEVKLDVIKHSERVIENVPEDYSDRSSLFPTRQYYRSKEGKPLTDRTLLRGSQAERTDAYNAFDKAT